ncbi:MAG: MAPEG family protein [Gammaproteobacteria bacterium]|nr:MAPEG family protein [Gammaproteobacteria bacterium]
MLVTPLFAALFGVLYFILSINVVRFRLGQRVSLGNGDNQDIEKAIRIHANFIEYVPLILLLFYFYEVMSLSSSLVLFLASTLFIARVCHIIGMVNPTELVLLRQVGAAVTFLVLVVISCALALKYIPVSV